MIMLTLLNAQERDENEFKALFAEADARFKFQVSRFIVLPVWQLILNRALHGLKAAV